VSCSSPTACTAVGHFVTAGPAASKTLAERWNGTKWTIQPTPSPGTSPELDAVSCPSLTACTAVGSYVAKSGAEKTLAERWNGTTWTIQSSPNPAVISATLLGVSCPSRTDCTAVGRSDTNPEGTAAKTLAERWNGTTWTIQATANPAGSVSSLLDADSCSSPAACTAVGYYQASNNNYRTLAERYRK
jgi:mannosyltransferase OCH1-like enzyme